MEKFTFAVQDAKLVEEKPDSNFAVVEIDAFANGKNAHNLYVSEDTLRKTASTILLKPITYAYSPYTRDFLGHEKIQLIAGFVPHDSPLNFKEMPDGRTFLSVRGYIWKKYVQNFMETFQRSSEKKRSVSVEMEVSKMVEREGYEGEILDFSYSAITVLGKVVKSAIQNAEIEFVSFAEEQEEFNRLLVYEFGKYGELDLSIPENIKTIVKEALDNYKVFGGATNLSLATARHLLNNAKASPEKIRLMAKKLKNLLKLPVETDEQKTKLSLWGGREGYEWASKIESQMNEIDSRRLAYFTEVSMDESVTLDEPKSTLLEFEGKEEKSDMDEKEKENVEVFAEEKEPEGVKDSPEEEKKETPEEQKKEETPPAEEDKKEEMSIVEKMSLDAYVDMAEILRMLEAETEEEKELNDESVVMACKMAVDELKKEGEKEFGIVAKGMFCKMAKMTYALKKMAEKQNVYLAENEELKRFKAGIEEQRFQYEVEQTLREVENAMPGDEIDKSREDAKQFSLENINIWKNSVKAKAFSFSTEKKPSKKTDVTEVPRWATNFDNVKKSKDALWTIKSK